MVLSRVENLPEASWVYASAPIISPCPAWWDILFSLSLPFYARYKPAPFHKCLGLEKCGSPRPLAVWVGFFQKPCKENCNAFHPLQDSTYILCYERQMLHTCCIRFLLYTLFPNLPVANSPGFLTCSHLAERP